MDSTTPDSQWYWSQRGAVMGPIDFDELARLAATGSVTHDTWVHDPVTRAWIPAHRVDGLFAVTDAPPPVAPPVPPAFTPPPPDARGAAGSGPTRVPAAPKASIDPRSAAILCRVSILLAPFLNVFAVVGPAIVWALGPSDQRVAAEAKAALNCLLVSALVVIAAIVISVVGAVVLVGPFIGGLMTIGLALYLIVNGIRGLIAVSNNQPFSYPWMPTIIA